MTKLDTFTAFLFYVLEKQLYYSRSNFSKGLLWWLNSKEPTSQCRDAGLITGIGESPGEGNGNPLQYSCLGNPMDRGVWWTTVHGVTKSQT